MDQNETRASSQAPTGRPQPHQASATARIEAFSDGVFAIVITLLILEIKVPSPESIHGAVGPELAHRLWELYPKLIAYVLSFAIVGTFWVAHHNIFKLVHRLDRVIIWINIAFLMCVAFIPFPTALVGEYVHQPIGMVIYGVTLIACSLTLLWLWTYATSGHRLVDRELAPELIRRVRKGMFLAPPVYLAAIGLAYFNVWVSILVCASLQIYYMLPGHIDRHVRNDR